MLWWVHDYKDHKSASSGIPYNRGGNRLELLSYSGHIMYKPNSLEKAIIMGRKEKRIISSKEERLSYSGEYTIGRPEKPG